MLLDLLVGGVGVIFLCYHNMFGRKCYVTIDIEGHSPGLVPVFNSRENKAYGQCGHFNMRICLM